MPLELRSRISPAPHIVPNTRDDFYRNSPRGASADYLLGEARLLEDEGYDGAYVPQSSTWPDPWLVSGRILAATRRVTIAAAHRIGLQQPTVAARQLATLDWLSGGRAQAHLLIGLSSDDQGRDGDHLDKADRYRRADEYLTVLRTWLTSSARFDFHGEFYDVTDAERGVEPVQRPAPPISYGGAADESIALAGRHADIYGFLIEPLEGAAELVARVRETAAANGRTIRFWITGNHVLAPTDGEAWDKARAAAAAVDTAAMAAQVAERRNRLEGELQRRTLRAAAAAESYDRALFTGISRATGGSAAPLLVGSPATVAEALLDYYDLGVEIIGTVPHVVDGVNPDAELKRELLSLVREGARRRDLAGSDARADGIVRA